MKPNRPKRRPKTTEAEPKSTVPDFKAETEAIPAGRRRVFRAMAVALPLVFALVLEVCLRLFGYGHSTGLFRTVSENGTNYLVQNDQFTLRFFPPELARWPGCIKFPAEKAPGTYRIFVLGESAAMGDPQPAFGAARYMEALLEERYPSARFEVINVAITAINSHVILPIAKSCAEQQGDIWIVYMGNNEMVGPYGAATVFGSQAPAVGVVRFFLKVQQSRVGQLLMGVARGLSGRPENASWGGMQMFIRNQVPPGDKRRETVYRNFEVNLRDICKSGTSAGAQVILNTVAVNLQDCPPFGSAMTTNLPAPALTELQQVWTRGLLLHKDGDFTNAGPYFRRAAELDRTFAEAHYRYAQYLLRSGDAAGAEKHFELACENDTLPFRADSRINAAIRRTGQELGGERLLMVDTEETLGKLSPHGLPGHNLLFEHVHFNFRGNYELGKLWAEQIATRLAVASTTNSWASQQICENRLGLSDWNRTFVLQSMLRRMQQVPLSHQDNNPERMNGIRAQEREIQARIAEPGAAEKARAAFEAALKLAPDDPFILESFANFLEATGDRQGATAVYDRLHHIIPHDFYTCLQLGRLYGEQGRFGESERLLRKAVGLRKSLPEPWYELSNVLAAQEQYAEALKGYAKAAELRPSEPTYVSYQGKVLSKMNRKTEAISYYRRAIQLRPNYWEARFELAGELVALNQVGQAVEEYREVIRINPGFALGHINLGVMFIRQGNLQEAVQCFENALRVEPGNVTASHYLQQTRTRLQQGQLK